VVDEAAEDVRIIAWTTTPWTLPSNTALTVGGNIDYVKIKTKNPYTHAPMSVVLAEKLVSKWFGGKNQPTIDSQSASFKGKVLDGVRYEQLMDFGNEIQPLNGKNDAFRVILGDFVTTEDGTGIVHTAPSFGGEDMKVSRQNGIGSLTLVDKQGKFVDTVGEFSNRYVKNYKDEADYVDVNVDISVRLKIEGFAFNVQKYVHTYPHCWRTDKPILYYPLDSWFIAASKAKERMFELNQTINWKPAATGEGRFGKWLENLQDWNLSRSRYWGIPLPIWRSKDEEILEEKIIGSMSELSAEIEKANKILGLNQKMPKDLHRPYIDEVVLVSDNGQAMYRELDLIDVWFDSGAMPYAQYHLSPPSPPEGGEFASPQYISEPRYLTGNKDIIEHLLKFAKANRQNPTPAEELLWQELRGKKLEGFKFRRQHPMGRYIADFVCLKRRLVIELDGSYHNHPEIQELDEFRSEFLHYHGFKVIRFKNEDVLNLKDEVIGQIYKELNHRPAFSNADLSVGMHLLPPFGGAGGGRFPADFIAEGVDQTRGWFYTLHAIATMAYDSVAFKNVVSNGLVLDKNGNKMSKRLGNAVDPFETLDKFGADATRWYMISNAQPWDNLKFNLDGITEVRNKFFGTLYNTYNFFAMYANVDGFVQDEMNQTPMENRTELDRWVLSRLHSLIADVSKFYSDYEPTQAARAIENFVDNDFSNWYVRLSRRRFWKGAMNADKKAAYETMFECLMVVGQLSSPIAPFFSDWLYQNLTNGIRQKAIENNTPLRHESVHLTDLTKSDNSLIDKELEQRMDYAQRISSLILSLRKRERLRVRQPLSRVMLPILDENFIAQVEAVKTLILAETNVKTFEYITDTHGVVVKKIKPNFKTLGKTLGANMRFAQAAIEQLSQDDILKIEKEKAFNLVLNGENYTLSADDFLITSEDIPGWFVASDGDVTVALDVTLTPALEAEGTARDLVNKIQNIRKDQNFSITDKISVKIERHDAILAAVEQFSDYIKEEVLATDLALVEHSSVEKIDLNDSVSLKIEVSLN
jgi:isoleucyl-tRNA synthetase/very-short-patch-repair endonuclease